MKQITDYIDDIGAVCHGTPEAWERGDSARETGTLWILNGEPNMGYTLARAFVVNGGTALCRHNYSNTDWHRDPKEFSRDQWTALACAAVMNPKSYLRNLLWREQKKHHLKSQNKDIITYEYNLYIRMFRLWYLWPLLLILDLGLIVNAIIRCYKNRPSSELSDNVGDDLNITSMIYVATKVLPTPTNWLARMIYKTFHPGIQKAWDWYYRHPENPPMQEIWKPVITKYFS